MVQIQECSSRTSHDNYCLAQRRQCQHQNRSRYHSNIKLSNWSEMSHLRRQVRFRSRLCVLILTWWIQRCQRTHIWIRSYMKNRNKLIQRRHKPSWKKWKKRITRKGLAPRKMNIKMHHQLADHPSWAEDYLHWHRLQLLETVVQVVEEAYRIDHSPKAVLSCLGHLSLHLMPS